MTDLHRAPFKWPAGPSKVIVTGSFDHWSCSTELTKTDAGFVGSFDLPWDHKFMYKYIVDGQWKTNPGEPQESDKAGNINNVYTTPTKPVVTVSNPPPATASSPPAVEKTSMEEAKGNAAAIVSYMASGLGAAFASVTGIDPINPQQIPIEDDKAKEVLASTSVPGPDARKAEPAPTIGTAHDPLVPEAPVDAKKPYDALAPIADEPIVLPTVSTITQAASNAASTAATYVTDAATAVKNAIPTSYLPAAVAEATPATSNGIHIPNAVEPYAEHITAEPVSIPDAVEPYKATNGTLPGSLESAPSKAAEVASKVSGETSTRVSEAASKVKDAVTLKTPPTSPKKGKFDASEASGSVRSGTEGGTPKRKKRNSLFGKLKEVLTPEKKRKHTLSNSVSS